MRSSIDYGGWSVFSSKRAAFGRYQISIHGSIEHSILHCRNKSRIRSKRLRIGRNDPSIRMQKCIVPKIHQRQYDWQVVSRIRVYKVTIDIVRSGKERGCDVPSKYERERLYATVRVVKEACGLFRIITAMEKKWCSRKDSSQIQYTRTHVPADQLQKMW
mmetsp:Transcript_32533/g.68306  ORF Transcript_32533/g.68306 Transcript_32533/m.68306 type:complete len:160 (-) Transcript_32533:124-603(-)